MVKLKFSYDYKPQLVDSVERRPRLCFYLSSDAGRDYLRVNPASDSCEVTLDISTEDLQADSTLTVFTFVDTKNRRQEPSSNEAGANYVFLKDVMSAVRETEITLPLVVWNARRSNVDAQKGKITLRFQRANFVHGKSPFAAPSKYTITQENRAFIVNTLVGYLKRCNMIYEKKPSTFTSVARLHLPTWNFVGWAVPGMGFGCVRAKHSPEAWWSNAADIALRRHYPKMTLSGARSYLVNLATEPEVMVVVSKMLSVYINYCTYLSDGIPVEKRPAQISLPFVGAQSSGSVEHVSMEAFSNNLRSRGSPVREMRPGVYDYVPPGGDCEDGAAEQGFEAMELRNRTDWTDPVLRKMHEARQNYFYLQVLMGVRGAQLSDGDSGERAYEQLGGHMAGAFVAQETFMKMHKRYNAAAQPYEGLKAASGARAPIMFLEGTGLIDPENSASYAQTMRSYRYMSEGNSTAFSGLKFIAPQTANKLNAFYRVVQSVTVLDLVDEGYSAVEHVLLRRDKRTGSTTTGVSHLEFINESPLVETYAMPSMDEDELRVTKQILKQAPPIQPFEVPQRLSSEKVVEPNLQAVRDAMDQLNRKSSDNFDVASFYIRFDQLPGVRDRFISMIRSKERVFKFKYFAEEITKGFGGFHVQFFVSNE